MEIFSLKNKTVVVTGATGLLGKAHCEALAEAGANVVLADLSEQSCIEIASNIKGKHLGIGMDVTNINSVKSAKEKILERYGSIDVLVNNAAINDKFENPLLGAQQSMFENYPISMFNNSWEVNVAGVFICCQVLGSAMLAQGYGSIINIASTYGIVAPDQSIYKNEKGEQEFYKSPAYPVTKSAVIGFTKYLAAYWGKNNIRVNSLSPGGVENNQDEFFKNNYAAKTLLGRMATREDYKGAVVFLASDASAYMTGANLVVDGGWTTI